MEMKKEEMGRKGNWLEGYWSALIDHSVCLAVSVGNEELENNVKEESKLPNNVEYK